jgi:hypothetical protein
MGVFMGSLQEEGAEKAGVPAVTYVKQPAYKL